VGGRLFLGPVFDHLHEYFALLDHSEILPRAFLDGLRALFQIGDFGIERSIPLLPPLTLALQLNDPILHPAQFEDVAVPEPQPVLKQADQYQQKEDDPLHGGSRLWSAITSDA
jgi:hypothetical protein